MKKMLLAVVMVAICLPASAADFFSKAGGYYKIEVPPGYKIIANQLVRTTNSIPRLFAGWPNGTIILKWSVNGFLSNQFDEGFNEWADPDQTLVPGESAFIFNPAPTNITLYMYGELLQGTLTNALTSGYSLLSSKVPQAGTLQQVLGFPPSPDDLILRWTNGYTPYNYDADFLAWDTEPFISVGEGFFLFRTGPSPTAWTRTFVLN